MKEYAPTRREIIGDSPNKPEQIRSIETLQQVGFLKPMRDLDLYHGRSNHGEKWLVQEVDNAGNNTGNYNINRIPALHTGNLGVAKEFAEARVRRDRRKGDSTKAEVHKIISADPDASIIDCEFKWGNLSKLQQQDAMRAIRKTLPSVFEGSPLSFEDRHAVDNLKMDDFLVDKKYRGFISTDMIKGYAERYNLSEKLSEQITGAINARLFLSNYPQTMNKIIGAFTENTGRATIDGVPFPINREYVGTWLQRMHVVGEKMPVNSATLGKPIDTYMLFDFERVNTEAEVEKRVAERNRRFGKLALAGMKKNERAPKMDINEALHNPYATPKQIMDAAKKVPGFREIFDADAGNWEKFSLGEHTETVLENFEYNYADRIPAALLPVMKLSLLVHDIGKSEAVRDGMKKDQERYNIFYAERFMQAIQVSDRDREFVLRMIGQGKTMVQKFLFDGRQREDLAKIRDYCKHTFQRYTGKRGDDLDAHGVFSMIMALQTCDSAAYTDMALTRSKERPGIVYRNKGVFNQSFRSHGITHRGATIK